MTKPKKQHYVPQFLLRNFANGRKNKAKVWVLDKKFSKIYPASVRDVAHENKFYEYHGESGDLEFEDLMGKLDSIGAGIIAAMTKKSKIPDSAEAQTWLSYFVAAQMIRTPSVREDMENFRQMIIHKWGGDIKAHPDDPKTIGEYGPEDAKISSLGLIKDVPKFAEMLKDKVWFLCESPEISPYIISDSPVTKHNMIDHWPRSSLGLRKEGIEVYMPFSSNLMLHIMCPTIAEAALRTPILEAEFSRSLHTNIPFKHEPGNVEFVNSLQVIYAERFVYAKEKEHLEMPLDMLRTNPELKEGPGVRQKPGEDTWSEINSTRGGIQ